MSKNKNEFTLMDVGMAYRKAKVDLYYSTHACMRSLVDYEESLEDNLQALLRKLNSPDEEWVGYEEFLGGWIPAPAGMDFGDGHGEMAIFSSPGRYWNEIKKRRFVNDRKPVAEFRVMARNSMDFHVLSALWLIEVGDQFDAKLRPCAYGNRLRRTEDGRYNPLSLGSFNPYLKPYRDWRDSGMNAMRGALEKDTKLVAITADVSGFYHNLDPLFMLNSRFLDFCGIELNARQAKLHHLFITALKLWADRTPLGRGLPVGLPASAVIANIALYELDRVMEDQVNPLHYGRYVDDLIIVLNNRPGFASSQEVWEWLIARSNGLLVSGTDLVSREGGQNSKICMRSDLLGESRIEFLNEKNKIFILEGKSGLALLESITRHISDRASEWRSLPNLPEGPAEVTTDVIKALTSEGDEADNLRKTDSVTTRRAAFALKLRDFEAYERDLQPDTWRDQRAALYEAFLQQVLVLPWFFDLAGYLPRVIRLATSCADFGYVCQFLRALYRLQQEVQHNCDIGLKTLNSESRDKELASQCMDLWSAYLSSMLMECMSSAFPSSLSRSQINAWDKLRLEKYAVFQTHIPEDVLKLTARSMREQQARYFAHDVAHYPLRFTGLPRELYRKGVVPPRKGLALMLNSEELVENVVSEGLGELAKWLKFSHGKGIPPGLAFPTRPYTLPELYIVLADPFNSGKLEALDRVILALRGFASGTQLPSFDKNRVLCINRGDNNPDRRIAIASWATDERSWVAAVTRRPDPDNTRYQRLMRMVDAAIRDGGHIDYLVLPEVSLPPIWFLRLALKLGARGISLITGIEYIHARGRVVRNQVWSSLTHDSLGFPSLLVYRQDKQQPALHEERELEQLAHLTMKPANAWKSPPIVNHGDFLFSVLVCSELTNIFYRSSMRGKIDALFVPEWNRDLDSFNALVESAALDIHAYIIQCNDRKYGDSRIRAPYKDSWKRDVVRIRGGLVDYTVVGKIDVAALRAFQSSHRSPDAPFKPVPDGFKPSEVRKVLPSSGSS